MYNTAQLPVDYSRPTTPPLSGLPQNHQVVVNIQPRPMVQPYLHLIVGVCLLQLQQNANRNHLRMTLYNLCALNNWQNDDFYQYVTAVCEYAEYLQVNTGGNLEQVINQAAGELATIFSGLTYNTYPQLQQVMGPQLQGEINGLVQRYQQISSAISNWLNNQQWGGQQGQFAQPPQQWGGQPAAWGQQQGGWNQPQTAWGGARQNPGQFAMQQGAVPHHPPAGVGHQVTPPPREYRGVAGRGVSPQPEPVPVEEHVTFGANGVTRNPGRYGQSVMPSAAQPTAQPQTPTPPAEPPATAPSGPMLVPSYRSGVQKTFSSTQPYHVAYDPTKTALYHAIHPDGVVQEITKELAEAMDYEKHELQLTFPPKTNYDRKLAYIQPRWDAVSEAKTPAEIRAESDEFPEDESGWMETEEAVVVNEPLQAHSDVQAELMARYQLLKDGIRVIDEEPFSYHYYQLTPIYTESNHLGLLKGLESLGHFSEVALKLLTLRDRFGSVLWNLLNDRMTAHFNEVVERNMQLVGWEVESFVDDCDDFLALLEKKHGSSLIASLDNHTQDVVKASLHALRGERLGQYLDELSGATARDKEELAQHTLVLSELVSVTHVPWRASDLNLQFEGPTGALLESRFPELHKAVRTLFERVRKHGTPRHVLLKTKDHVTLKLYEGFIGTGFYLIGKGE